MSPTLPDSRTVENDGDVRYVPPDDAANDFDYASNVAKYLWAARFVSGRRVLDAGCGSGYGTRLIAERGARFALGVDRSAAAIAYARARHALPNAGFQPMDICRLALRSRSLDVVVSLDAIEHLQDYEGHVRESHRVLEPGGSFLVGTPNKNLTPILITSENPYHVHEFTPEEFDGLLRRFFREVHLYGLEFRDVAKKRRYFERMRRRGAAERDPEVKRIEKASAARAARFSRDVLARFSPALRRSPLLRRMGAALLEPLGLYRSPLEITVDDIAAVDGPLDEVPGLLAVCVK